MVLKKRWRYKKVDKWRELWTKGDERFGDFIILDKTTPQIREMFKGQNYEVSARRKINPKTINGRFKFFKTKQGALKFVRRYTKKY